MLKEACEGPWTSGFFGVDLDGQSYQAAPSASGVLSWIQDDNARNIALADTREAYVIFDSQATRQAFETRWQFLKEAAHVSVLPDTMVKSFVRRPFASEFTVARVVRIAAVMGAFFAVFLVLIQLPFLRHAPAVVSAGLAYLIPMDFTCVCSMDPASTVAGRPRGGFVHLPTSQALGVRKICMAAQPSL